MNNDHLEAYEAYNKALTIFRANRDTNSSELNEESGKFEEQLWYGKGLVCQKVLCFFWSSVYFNFVNSSTNTTRPKKRLDMG